VRRPRRHHDADRPGLPDATGLEADSPKGIELCLERQVGIFLGPLGAQYWNICSRSETSAGMLASALTSTPPGGRASKARANSAALASSVGM
jgi:hypothetical protein